MIDKSICSNCGNSLKPNWLECKYCHQPRWKMISPYFIWGVIFVAFAWWVFQQKMPSSTGPSDLFTLMLPIAGATFGLIGIVMLLMSAIAALRGLTVRRQPLISAPVGVSPITPAVILPLAGVGEEGISIPSSQSAQDFPVTLKDQTIHCQKCRHENPPSALKCSQCGTNLLPGQSLGQRSFSVITTTIVGVISIIAAALIFRFKPEIGGKDLIYLAGVVIFGIFVFGWGIIHALRKIPLHERYAVRAKRHVDLNPQQALSDYGSAIMNSIPAQALEYLLERAALYQNLNLPAQARSDWQSALQNIDARMAKLKGPDLDLKKRHAEINKNLGRQDEYRLEMLEYTIEKEKTFKFKEGDIAIGAGEGFKKGTEDVERAKLRQLRTEVMQDTRFKIVGKCKQCRSVVELDPNLACTNNPKHRKITDIKAELRS